MTADLSTFESTQNPNGKVTYGVLHKVTACQQKSFDQAQIPAQYQGDVNAHPYAVTYGGSGVWYVADAGGNDIIRVSPERHARPWSR